MMKRGKIVGQISMKQLIEGVIKKYNSKNCNKIQI